MNLERAASGVRIVCFDLGGVVIRICRDWMEGCAAAGLDVRRAAADAEASAARHDANVRYQTGRIDGPAYAHELSGILGGVYSADEVMAVHDAWLLGEYPGMGALIDRLHDSGFETACLSNTNHDHWVRISEFPAVMKLGHRLASHELGLHKPDDAIYADFERRIGAAPEEIVFFDDLAENVEAARDRGWHAFEIDPHGDPAAQVARHVGLS